MPGNPPSAGVDQKGNSGGCGSAQAIDCHRATIGMETKRFPNLELCTLENPRGVNKRISLALCTFRTNKMKLYIFAAESKLSVGQEGSDC